MCSKSLLFIVHGPGEHRGIAPTSPFSCRGNCYPALIGALFLNQEFINYWYTTGTPTFLLDLLQSKQYDLKMLTQCKVGAAAFDASEPQYMEAQSLFVQTGYLTIKSYTDPMYQLDFPNFEVKKSFYDSVAARYAHIGRGASQRY